MIVDQYKEHMLRLIMLADYNRHFLQTFEISSNPEGNLHNYVLRICPVMGPAVGEVLRILDLFNETWDENAPIHWKCKSPSMIMDICVM